MDPKAEVKRLEKELATYLESGRWKEWLTFQARFHRYSTANSWLILIQRPGATRVAGYRTWQTVGRQVRGGSKGIAILAPISRRREKGKEDGDEEREEVRRSVWFKTVYVFDVADTDGDPLPRASEDLTGNDVPLVTLMGRAEALGVPVSEKPMRESLGGYYADGKVTLNANKPPMQRAKTLAHELAHHVGGHKPCADEREMQEVFAESVAFAVMSAMGVDSSSYTLGYLGVWAGDSGPAAVRLMAEAVQGTAEKIIGRAT